MSERKNIFDVIDDWRSTFGLHEFECLAKVIVNFLKEEGKKPDPLWGWGHPLQGWDKIFTFSDVSEKPNLFAAFAAAGWIEHVWFPKWHFKVSERFIESCPTETYEERVRLKREATAEMNRRG